MYACVTQKSGSVWGKMNIIILQQKQQHRNRNNNSYNKLAG